LDPSSFAAQSFAAFLAHCTAHSDGQEEGLAEAIGVVSGDARASGGMLVGLRKLCSILENSAKLWLCLPAECTEVEVSGIGLRGVRWFRPDTAAHSDVSIPSSSRTSIGARSAREQVYSREKRSIGGLGRRLGDGSSNGLSEQGAMVVVPCMARLVDFQDTLEEPS